MTDGRGSMTDIHYQWISVESDQGIPFQLSGEVAPSLVFLQEKPAIYRWLFLKDGVPRKAYIGKTENLRRRIRGYLNPGPSQGTNKRINREFKRALEMGLTVNLEVLRVEPVRINRVWINTDHLFDPFVRKMLESFILADFDVTNCELLNAALNPMERRRLRASKDDLPGLLA